MEMRDIPPPDDWPGRDDGNEWRQVTRWCSRAAYTQLGASVSVLLATASWTAVERCWPWPVSSRYWSAPMTAMAETSPAIW